MARALLLVAHGSRDPNWRLPFERLRDELAREAELLLALCYLQLCEPDFATAVATLAERGASAIRVLPLFMAGGSHVTADIPTLAAQARARHPGLHFDLLPAIGEHPRFAELLRELARDDAN